VPVVVTKVARSSIPVYLNGLGNVSPYYTVTVKSRVDGQLLRWRTTRLWWPTRRLTLTVTSYW
jgi:multidrug efflux pump subunit AcrA (membrane-fusion protein)